MVQHKDLFINFLMKLIIFNPNVGHLSSASVRRLPEWDHDELWRCAFTQCNSKIHSKLCRVSVSVRVCVRALNE